MFFIGDIVEVKSWEELVEEFGIIEVAGIQFIDCDFYFSPEMKHLCGVRFKVEETVEAVYRVDDSTLVLNVEDYSKGLQAVVDKNPSDDSSYFWRISSDMLKAI